MNPTPDSPVHPTPTVDATGRVPAHGQRALVLGGGGSTGNAWLIGIVAGLFDAGLDVTTADLTVGTSAGATAAAQLAGAAPTELLAAVLSAPPTAPTRPGRVPTGPMGPDRGRTVTTSVADHLDRFRLMIAAAADQAELRRTMGAAALQAAADASGSARWRATVASRLPAPDWPRRTVLITAVDAHTGDPVVFDRHSGVDLVDAVAASTSGGGSAYRIDGRGYIDGGYR